MYLIVGIIVLVFGIGNDTMGAFCTSDNNEILPTNSANVSAAAATFFLDVSSFASCFICCSPYSYFYTIIRGSLFLPHSFPCG